MNEVIQAEAPMAGSIATSRCLRMTTVKLAIDSDMITARNLPYMLPPQGEPTSMMVTPARATALAISVERLGSRR